MGSSAGWRLGVRLGAAAAVRTAAAAGLLWAGAGPGVAEPETGPAVVEPEAGPESDAGPTPEREGVEPARTVELQDLLKLPDSLRYDVERRGGATRGEWRERFRTVREQLGQQRTSLERSKRELEQVAGSADAWKFAPPGAGDLGDAPLDYRLRNEIRQSQGEVKRLEKRLRDLDVEANLAGVPDDWRK